MSATDQAVKEVARDLRAQGRSVPSIARELGVSPNAVYRWTDPEVERRHREMQRARRSSPEGRLRKRTTDSEYKRRRRAEGVYGVCSLCGKGLGEGNSFGTCKDCVSRDSAEQATRVIAMWVAGATYPEIIEAEFPGREKAQNLGSYFNRLRAAGYAVPRRRPGLGVHWVDALPTAPIVVEPGWTCAGSKA